MTMPYKDPEKKRKAYRRWREANREKLREYQKAYSASRKDDPAVRAANVKRQLEYRARHKDDPKFQESQRSIERRRYAKRKEKQQAYQLARNRKNKAKVNAYNRAWCEANREKVRAYNREYSRAHRDPLKDAERNQRSRVGRRSGEHFTKEEWAARLDEFDHRCAFCLQKKKLTVEHVIDIDSGGGNGIDNIVPACGSCNSRKCNRGMLYMATRIAA